MTRWTPERVVAWGTLPLFDPAAAPVQVRVRPRRPGRGTFGGPGTAWVSVATQPGRRGSLSKFGPTAEEALAAMDRALRDRGLEELPPPRTVLVVRPESADLYAGAEALGFELRVEG